MSTTCDNTILAIKDIVVVLGFPLAILAAALALAQLRRTITWNKLNATFALFPNKQYTEHQALVATEFIRLGIPFSSRLDPLTEAEVASIVNDPAAHGALRSFLNYLEDYSTALLGGVLHKGAAFQLMGDALTRYFRIFEPLIRLRREVMCQPALWVEFQMASEVFKRLLETRASNQTKRPIENEIATIEYLQRSASKEWYRSFPSEDEASPKPWWKFW